MHCISALWTCCLKVFLLIIFVIFFWRVDQSFSWLFPQSPHLWMHLPTYISIYQPISRNGRDGDGNHTESGKDGAIVHLTLVSSGNLHPGILLVCNNAKRVAKKVSMQFELKTTCILYIFASVRPAHVSTKWMSWRTWERREF